MSNFKFLKKKNENLFDIICEAEKLFRDEYFEQVIIQTRRFAESVCKDLLQGKVISDETFDSMINRIKDQSFGNLRLKEFTDDLYFIKRQGNNSAHSSVATKDGKAALECLERAYEIAVFYSNAKYGYSKKLDKSVFSEELLMTGVTVKKNSLKEKYTQELRKNREQSLSTTRKKSSRSTESKARAEKVSVFSLVFKIAVISYLIFIAIAYIYEHINVFF